MADQTHIEWTDATWNIITGCSVVSPGCTNCYAMKLAGTRLQHHPSRAGLTTPSKSGPVWNGQVRFNADWLDQPIRWSRPRMIFVCAHGDLFHDGVTDDWLDQIFAVMALTPHHTYQVLTKRPKRMRAYLTAGLGRIADRIIAMRRARGDQDMTVVPLPHLQPGARWWPLPNVWLGVSVEDQARADERIPILLDTPAAVRWISAEPLLGPVDLDSARGGTQWIGGQRGCGGMHRGKGTPDCPREPHHHHDERCRRGLDWVVVGGESGPGSRPMHPDWARSLRDQCAAADVPFLFKQWGDWGPVTVEGDPGWDTIDDGPELRTYIDPRETCLLHVDGQRDDDFGLARPDPEPRQMLLIGKKDAGRHLDGRLHDGFPTRPATDHGRA